MYKCYFRFYFIVGNLSWSFIYSESNPTLYDMWMLNSNYIHLFITGRYIYLPVYYYNLFIHILCFLCVYFVCCCFCFCLFVYLFVCLLVLFVFVFFSLTSIQFCSCVWKSDILKHAHINFVNFHQIYWKHLHCPWMFWLVKWLFTNLG